MRLAPLALVIAATLTGCFGDIRETTTARTAQEQLLCSTAAFRAVSHVDSSRFAGRHVFVDAGRLASLERGFIVSAFDQLVSEAGGHLVPATDKADLVVEVRSAALGCYDGKWVLYAPLEYLPYPVPPPSGAPKLITIGYSLQEGWARLDAFAYDPRTGNHVCGWRDAWGRAYVGFFDDIYPSTTIAESLEARVE